MSIVKIAIPQQRLIDSPVSAQSWRENKLIPPIATVILQMPSVPATIPRIVPVMYSMIYADVIIVSVSPVKLI